jgi:hypothetical protein
MVRHKTKDSARDSGRYSVRLALAIWFGFSGIVWLGIAVLATRL